MARIGRPEKNQEEQRIFSENLTRFLAENGISQTAFAKKLGIPPSRVSEWCNQKKLATEINKYRIAVALNKTVEELTTE